ncbi:protein EXECUTER 1, chloroplastic isoform X2 [Arabidopsis lyrata subsp. lyrata]|uniref:protein EXECUTER 1, chloroplastic isoform X2 n=1 Tax=Arabidopsis lyrata subsp. lyrata TaxID=81972 RepID=UPI000A29BF40|nr:protein EXECUTER 1, chloroplastic isoform X2 [Arabidopsis lyrata subsp. lyrata]|eukprot:XP_020873950.1 protein EXECUTER 1, chloroplastic isoform X2 [Arabidopsis lyrata subsp. lyrata]
MPSLSTPPSQNLAFSPAASATSSRLTPSKRPFYPHRLPDPTALCRCSSSSSDDNPRWDSAIQDVLKSAIKRFDAVLSWYTTTLDNDAGENVEKIDDDWDWDRWKKHFEQVDDQDRLLSVLKSQLNRAIKREDYEDAARLKVAIAATATNDAVGKVMSTFYRAVLEERYKDAVYLRDKAGAGLVGWWSGISQDVKDPFGLIVQITAEHGRYVARSYNPRQLSTSAAGAPLFEIFLTLDGKGNYKKQAVYLKWKEIFPDVPTMPSRTLTSGRFLTSPGRKEDTGNLTVESSEDEESDNSDDDSDLLEESYGFQSFLRDMIPGVKVKVMKVTAPGRVDKDFISKVIEQIADEEDEENDLDIEDIDVEDETKAEIDEKNTHIELESVTDEIIDNNGGREIAVKFVIGDIVDRLSGNQPIKESLRSPANLESVENSSFYLRLEKDLNVKESKGVEGTLVDGKGSRQSRRRIDNIMVDLAKSIEKEKKISVKMLKDVGELLSLTLSQAQNRQQLSGLTKFRRIDVTPSLDPLDGLYIGAHGLYTSEVIHLKRKFGQWKGGKESKKPTDIEFYEYVEAVKLTGDPYVPAGKVAFRAKIGRRYELPHKGLIPEEFGVIARYKGQGRLADPGFRNPRWVDGELVILDGKYVKGGPVVGFVYWAPEYHFVMFFNRLRLQD